MRKPTPSQLTNRQRLVRYLVYGNIQSPFTMEVHDYDPLGHAKHIGIKKRNEETWVQFANRAFGFDCDADPETWQYLFSAAWANANNTPSAAAQRIRQVTASQIPTDWKQKIGLATND